MHLPLAYTESGPKDAPILFFIHGWPDTGELWKNQVEHFSKDYLCICITLPAFAEGDTQSAVDFPELVERLVATIKEVGNSQPVVVVGHDWGAYLTYLLDQNHPTIASRLITMDVGAHFQPSSFGHALFMVSYQWWLVAAYFIGKMIPPLGSAMTRWFSKIAHAPRGRNVFHRSNYPYFYFWRARLFKKYRRALPARYRPTKPLLYLYGAKKKYNFHSPKWEQIVREVPGSNVVALAGCDHWLMVRDADATNRQMREWLG